MRSSVTPFRRWYAAVLCLVLGSMQGSCGGSGPQGPGNDGGAGTAVPALTVHVTLEPSEGPIADALGWMTGVPDAEVHLNRNGTTTFEIDRTDDTGTVVFDDLLPGLYRVFVERRLSGPEAGIAGVAVGAFGDGQTIEVRSPTTLELQMAGQQAPGLVISEISAELPPSVETPPGTYWDGVYFELFNSSDEVKYLDGRLFGLAYTTGYQDYDHTPCAVSQVVREDPSGIHARWFLRFPGSGTEYPVAPGQTALIAQSAIDHTPVHPNLLDLSHADFEVHADRNANNPAVPDMIDVGIEGWFAGFLVATSHLYFLSEPLDPGTLPIAYRDPAGHGFVRVPAASIIDAAGFYSLWPDQDLEHPPCSPFAADVFERYEGGLDDITPGSSPDTYESLQRRLLRTEGGLSILQNTNTSAVDFAFRARTPGWVP